MYRTFGKRLFDLTIIIPALIILLPVMLLVALLIRMKMGGPVVFVQERAGLHGRPFWLFKFRTMTDARDADGKLLSDHQRITPLGRFLRSTSLDELPGLLNVLRGEMSLIGPRPLLVKYLSRYTPEQNRRHEVKPGVAGLPALYGRSEQSWENSLAHDVWYVDHMSLWLDLKIIFGVLIVVFKREGVGRSADGFVPEFMGSPAPRVVERVLEGEPAPSMPALGSILLQESDTSVTV